MSLDRGSRFRAGTNDATTAAQRGSLEPDQAFRRGSGKSGFLGERMVDECDEPQAAPMGRDRRFEIGKRETVNYCRCAVGESRQCRCPIIRGKLDHFYCVPAGPQTHDDVTVVKIPTGQLIEPARDDKDELGHSSAAS
jgi:hypothetical protein